jgi:hypothetical protein
VSTSGEITVEELKAALLDQDPSTVPDPYSGVGWNGVQDPEAVDDSDPFLPRAYQHLAPRTTKQAATWLHDERRADHRYYRECLILQREARGIPNLYPTAYAASQGTPRAERIQRVSNLRRGMVGFSKGTDPSGHVFFILGRRKGFATDDPDGVLTESNDVVAGRTGAIGIVPLSFYHNAWGHTFQFGATYLNGYDFRDPNKAPRLVHSHLGDNYLHAIQDMKKVVAAHAGDKDKALEASLRQALAHMERKYAKRKA